MAIQLYTNTEIRFVIHEYQDFPNYCRTGVVLTQDASAYVPGTVLGKVTATGKYVRCDKTAVDGSQTAVAILAPNPFPHPDFNKGEWDATGGDIDGTVWIRGPLVFNEKALVTIGDANDRTSMKNDLGFIQFTMEVTTP